ncbi:hypothetical protein [Salipiger aestuarii]|uniref:hypothetical protein n=1 Tax=Salipiger aestuarii TaxID=568098 RepID=UPI0011B942FA|nr:hypothetical protein [Salipiger aestuarii]
MSILLLPAALPAQALTVASMTRNDEIRYTVNDAASTTLTFELPDSTGGYANFGGYVKWSTLENGRKDGRDGLGICLECGYRGGGWSLGSYMSEAQTVTVNFGELRDTVHVWVRATHGQGTASYGSLPTLLAAPAVVATPAAVPVPAAGALLLGALALLGFGLPRRRSA